MRPESEHQPNVWGKLFPNTRQRELALMFVNKLSQLPDIERVVTMRVGKETNITQRLFVITKGLDNQITDEETDRVFNAWQEICETQEDGELLGITPIITESYFNDDSKRARYIGNRNITTLWKRPPSNTNTPNS